jgi:hypothetical protein
MSKTESVDLADYKIKRVMLCRCYKVDERDVAYVETKAVRLSALLLFWARCRRSIGMNKTVTS